MQNFLLVRFRPPILHSSFFILHSKMVGRHGFAPRSRRLRAGTSLSMLATQSRHEGGVEPPSRFRIGMKSWPAPVFASREMVGATGTAPVCSRSRSRRLTFRLRSEILPNALNPASGHYFDGARSLPAHQVQLGKMKWSSIRVLRPVFRFGRPACISQHLCSQNGVPCESRTHLRGFADHCLGCSANGTF